MVGHGENDHMHISCSARNEIISEGAGDLHFGVHASLTDSSEAKSLIRELTRSDKIWLARLSHCTLGPVQSVVGFVLGAGLEACPRDPAWPVD